MKISFIICYKNESKLQESIYYINRQEVPEGCEFDILPIADATSVAEGYQFGMKASDAKYKVYLPEDTLIIRKDFIPFLLEIFASDEKIGMFGFAGCDKFLDNALYHLQWNTSSIATFNGRRLQSRILGRERGTDKGNYSICDVMALDGMFLVTSQDIDWDTETGFGEFFFDIAQCVRMREAGYRVVVPVVNRPYILQDRASAPLNGFDKDANTFCDNYAKFGYINTDITIEHSHHLEKIQNLKDEFLIEEKKIRQDALEDTMMDAANKVLASIKEMLVVDGMDPDLHQYLALLSIYGADVESMGYSNIWPAGELEESITFYNNVKYLLWRSFFGAPEEDWEELVTAVSNGIISEKAISLISKSVTGVDFK